MTISCFREARVIFKPGINRDGYFTSENLLDQVDSAIDIFEGKAEGKAQGLFLFDNAPSHQKRAANALSARKMPKGTFSLDSTFVGLIMCHTAPRANWTHAKGGPRMRDGINPLTGKEQSLYFPQDHPSMAGWFKGMEEIIKERGLWPEQGLLADCSGSKCPADRNNCCCRKLLFHQLDFVSQKSELQEAVESRGHLCDFYPKYHCELNFIEQYWGAAKLKFRKAGRGAILEDMKKKVLASLDDIPLDTIRR